jgi:hypothetical protein
MLRTMLPQPRPPPLRLTNLHELSDVAVIKVRFVQSEHLVFAYAYALRFWWDIDWKTDL